MKTETRETKTKPVQMKFELLHGTYVAWEPYTTAEPPTQADRQKAKLCGRITKFNTETKKIKVWYERDRKGPPVLVYSEVDLVAKLGENKFKSLSSESYEERVMRLAEANFNPSQEASVVE